MPRGLRLALRLTRDSTHPKQALAAVLMAGGRVLGHAANSARWGRCAERRALGHGSYPGAVLYVARANAKCSKPCPKCEIAIRRAGVSKVVYVDLNGEVVSWNSYGLAK